MRITGTGTASRNDRLIQAADRLTRPAWLDFGQLPLNNPFMRANTMGMELNRWPYGLIVQLSDNGVTLRPVLKARAGWAKAFRRRQTSDDLAPIRRVVNQFDLNEWEW